MNDFILKIFEQLLDGLDDMFDIINLSEVLAAITEFERLVLTKDQLQTSKLMEFMMDLYTECPNQYLKYRLEILLRKWREVIYNESKKSRKPSHIVSDSVFEAILRDDDRFFETTSVTELLQRLSKSFDKSFKVIDMATALNTISVFENIHIPASELATTRLMKYVRRLRRHSTNIYLSNRLKGLVRKWRKTMFRNERHATA